MIIELILYYKKKSPSSLKTYLIRGKVILPSTDWQPMARTLKKGAKAPNFILKDQDGKGFELVRELESGPLVLYFYPHDDTPGCTAEACKFRDLYEEFTDRGVRVVGVSSDGIAPHRRFRKKHSLPFTLLHDDGEKVRKIYGVPKTLGLIPGRVTFLIDGTGKIIYTFSSQIKAEKHVIRSLEAVKNLLRS